MTHVAVIPARGNSKGLPRKNLLDLGGKPLVVWSIEAALAAGRIDRVVVSTDCPVIADVARTAGAEVPFMRPSALAGDDVHSVDVVLHALQWLHKNSDCVPQLAAMMLPTTPFRTGARIDEAIELFVQSHAPVVVGVSEVHKPLHAMRYRRPGGLVPILEFANLNRQRQQAETIWGINGSIYIATPETLREGRSFHLPGALPFPMSKRESIDIDDTEDLRIAEAICKVWYRGVCEGFIDP